MSSNENETNVTHLLSWIRDTVNEYKPTDTLSFIAGIEQFAADFAICRDGERYFGCRDYTTRQLSEALKRYYEEQY